MMMAEWMVSSSSQTETTETHIV